MTARPSAKLFTSATPRKIRAWTKALYPYAVKSMSGHRWRHNRRLAARNKPQDVDQDLRINVNNTQQWLRIRGNRRNNPVLLYLHGGPGGSQIPSYRHYQLPWENHLNIVHWEQRGAGRSYHAGRCGMNLPQLVDDCRQVIKFVSHYFQRQDLILLGHSWGSLLAYHVLQSRPENIAAYVGVGPVANQPQAERRMYRFAQQQAQHYNVSSAMAHLEKIDNYPQRSVRLHQEVATVRFWASRFNYLGSRPDDTARTYQRLMYTPEYSLLDVYRFLRGTLLSSATLGAQMLTDESIQPLHAEPASYVPSIFISGRRDHFTPADYSDDLFTLLQAPHKAHLVFDHSGHFPNEDEADRFLLSMAAFVNPYLATPIALR